MAWRWDMGHGTEMGHGCSLQHQHPWVLTSHPRVPHTGNCGRSSGRCRGSVPAVPNAESPSGVISGCPHRLLQALPWALREGGSSGVSSTHAYPAGFAMGSKCIPIHRFPIHRFPIHRIPVHARLGSAPVSLSLQVRGCGRGLAAQGMDGA